MESLDKAACFMDDLLDFGSDLGEEDDDETHNNKPSKTFPSITLGRSIPEFVEEELEWISNKDAFPAVETSFVDILSEHPATAPKHQSPVSVLDGGNSNSSNSSGSTVTNGNIVTYLCDNLRVPVRARSKLRRRCRRDLPTQESWSIQVSAKGANANAPVSSRTMGRKCQHCGAEKTPQWRAGPFGPKTLCNACGVRYKSGRLVPEYRPASSPTFSSELHSNSHRKILEMRRQKQHLGLWVVKPVDKG